MAATSAVPKVAPPLLGFRADIEGLRAVAVGLVVALHAGVSTVSGGYVGVDVFFVISGFLITSLLIDEVRATTRVSILGFYARRARRILPVACFVIAATVVAAYLQLGPLVGRAAAIDGQWAAGFSANVRFISQGTDYFASSIPSPLQHYWSLAVEEQFYLVWPTLLFGLVLLGRRFARSMLTLQLGIVATIAGSLYWSVHQSALAPTTAYFSPLTRAWELGVGALIAVFSVSISAIPAVLRAIATWIGLAFVAFAAFTFTAATVFPGSAALLPVVGAGLVTAGGIGRTRGGAGLLLGLPPLRFLGKISFSIYLWHWPVFVIAEERSFLPLSNVARIVCVLITVALSVGSYFAIENPLRTTDLLKVENARTSWGRSRKALLAGATAVLVAFTVSSYTNNRAELVINSASRGRGSGQSLAHGLTSSDASPKERIAALEQRVRNLVWEGLARHRIPPDVDPPLLQIETTLDPKYRRCTQEREETDLRPCTFGAVKSRETLVVFGDSHAMQWMPALDPYARQAGYRIVTLYKASCPVPSIEVYTASPESRYPQCAEWRTRALRYIRELEPAVVVLGFTHAFTAPGDTFDLTVWRSGLQTSLQRLKETGARIIEFGPNTFLPEDPALCLSRQGADPATCTGDFWGRDIVDAERPIVRAAGATFIDTEPWFCINGRCPVIIDDKIAYADESHVSAQYASHLEPLIVATLEAAGLRAPR